MVPPQVYLKARRICELFLGPNLLRFVRFRDAVYPACSSYPFVTMRDLSRALEVLEMPHGWQWLGGPE